MFHLKKEKNKRMKKGKRERMDLSTKIKNCTTLINYFFFLEGRRKKRGVKI